MRLVDLSLPLTSEMPHFDGTPPVYVASSHRLETEGYRMCTVFMGNHSGTHVDAPSHFLPDGASVDLIAIERCVGEALVLDLSAKGADEQISRGDLEAAVGDSVLAPGSRLLIRTDWDRQFEQPDYFTAFPALAPDTARWFVDRGVVLVGLDIPTLHPRAFAEMHRVMLAAQIVIVESLANLRLLKSRSVWFLGLPIKISGVDGAPTRAAAYDGLLRPDGD